MKRYIVTEEELLDLLTKTAAWESAIELSEIGSAHKAYEEALQKCGRRIVPEWAQFVGGVVGRNQGVKTVRYEDIPK